MIDQQIDSIPDYTPEQAEQPQPVSPSDQEIEQPHKLTSESTTVKEPKSITTPVRESTETGPEETIPHNTEPETPSSPKRTVTATRTSKPQGEKNNKPVLEEFTTSDGTVIQAKSHYSAAVRLANKLGGTPDSPVIVELTDKHGKTLAFETRMEKGIPRAKKVKPPAPHG